MLYVSTNCVAGIGKHGFAQHNSTYSTCTSTGFIHVYGRSIPSVNTKKFKANANLGALYACAPLIDGLDQSATYLSANGLASCRGGSRGGGAEGAQAPPLNFQKLIIYCLD